MIWFMDNEERIEELSQQIAASHDRAAWIQDGVERGHVQRNIGEEIYAIRETLTLMRERERLGGEAIGSC